MRDHGSSFCKLNGSASERTPHAPSLMLPVAGARLHNYHQRLETTHSEPRFRALLTEDDTERLELAKA
jgi:hypothetical protein